MMHEHKDRLVALGELFGKPCQPCFAIGSRMSAFLLGIEKHQPMTAFDAAALDEAVAIIHRLGKHG
ncbi:MAG: hypothetical protein ACK4QP_22040, partial [Pseudorhizobium sp.]